VPAYPTLIHTGPKKDEEVPQPYFNHAIVAAQGPDGEYILMDPTDENTKQLLPSYLDNKSYLVAHPEGEELLTSPITPATQNMLRITSNGALDRNGQLSMDSELRFEGINDNAYRGYFSRLKPEERRRFFESHVKKRLPGASVTDFKILPEDMQDTSQPLVVTLSVEAPDFPIEGSDLDMLPLPWYGTSIGYVNFVIGKTGLEKRKYLLVSRVACGVTESLQLDLSQYRSTLTEPLDLETIQTNTLAFEPVINI